MTDDLRERVQRLDPDRGLAPPDPVDGDRARTLLEAVMSTPVLPDRATQPDRSRRRAARWAVAVAGAAAAVALALGIAAVVADDEVATPPLALSLPSADPALSICAPFDPAVLGSADVAFAGTVATVADGTVTLDVDRWYRGGPADQVELAVPPGFTAALDGVDFTAGDRYLVAASGGTVQGCGSSGPADAPLEQAYAQVFG